MWSFQTFFTFDLSFLPCMPNFSAMDRIFAPVAAAAISPRTGGTIGLFWWTILITLLMGVATFCWFFSIMVFKYPEKSFNYRLLTKLEKLERIARFDPLAANTASVAPGSDVVPVKRLPNGTFNNARDLLNKYYNYNPDQLRLTNSVLKRSYILNYSDESPVYVKGTYAVTYVRPLTATDLVKNGWVVRAHSVDLEDVEIELMLPGKPADPKAPPYHPGESFTPRQQVLVLQRDQRFAKSGCRWPLRHGRADRLRQLQSRKSKEACRLLLPLILNVEAPLPITGAAPVSGEEPKVTAQATPGF